ncbi:MAG: hypothetical protein CUN49_02335 [Candidatus Thermofonsia Clade 1 bacterium]|jgi:hypothetical protein|uniref:Uncharacterized protein n=1 Tax=Candidatus Thermofonsia Clade 1 bacterium TaxID=2364210 RepID=A0A2M8PHM3_9CHLR|nr:MAG: hypothetical protein CUN49_02335 [Candidatus Thermofonsia Clade 1 bacterium]RMF50934.1 MAG: hypothetical protein D6749_09260 [Chloroflexota bacterium]
MTIVTLVLGLTLIGTPAEAHHGWSSYDLSRPVYVIGTVAEVIWQNPHVEVLLDVHGDIRLPANLAETPIPNFLERVGGRETLQKARLPSQAAKRWRLELAPISRMMQYGANRRAQVGETVAFVGYISRTVCDEMRIEVVIFSDGETQGLRNSPLPRQEPQPNPCNPDRPERRPLLQLGVPVEALLWKLRNAP